MSIGTILLVVLVLMLVGVLPSGRTRRRGGYGPSGVVGVICFDHHRPAPDGAPVAQRPTGAKIYQT